MNELFLSEPLGIEDRLKFLLNTHKGERWLHPSYGSDLDTNIFDFIHHQDERSIEREIKKNLLKHEPEILITKIEILNENDGAKIQINIEYLNHNGIINLLKHSF